MSAPAFRPSFASRPLLLGKETTIKLPTGDTHQGRYAIVDLADVLASHNERTFATTPGFPTNASGDNANDRNYTDDENAQAHVRAMAQQLDPDRLLTHSKNQHGTPIITTDGIVISGNGRTMGLKLAVTDFPEKYAAYKLALLAESDTYGWSHQHMGKVINHEPLARSTTDAAYPEHAPRQAAFQHPVLVRIDYDVTTYTTADFAQFNGDTRKSEAPIDRSMRLAAQLNAKPNCRTQFAELLATADTFTEFYGKHANVHALKKLLTECGVINQNDYSGLFTDAGMTTAGKDLVELLAAGLVLDKAALQASDTEGVRTLRHHIVVSLPVLLKNDTLAGFSIRAELNEAILLQREIATSATYSGSSATDEAFRATLSTFRMDGGTYSLAALYVNRLLQRGQRAFKKAVEELNARGENQGADMFGAQVTFAEAFQKFISGETAPETAAFIARYVKGQQPGATPAAHVPDKELVQATVSVDVNPPHPTPSLPTGVESQPLAFWTAKLRSYGHPTLAEQAEARKEIGKKTWKEFTLHPAQHLLALAGYLDEIIERGAHSTAYVDAYKVLFRLLINESAPAAPTAAAPVLALAASLDTGPGVAPVAADQLDQLTGGRFYAEHPDHVLGELKSVSGRFSARVDVVTGTLEAALARIPFELPAAENVAQTVLAPPVEALAAVAADNLRAAIQKTERTILARTKKNPQAPNAPLDAAAPVEVYTFAEAKRILNAHLSDDEIRCFLWHKRQDHEDWRGWSTWGWDDDNFGQRNQDNDDPDEATIQRWMRLGICAYDGHRYRYAPLFYSGLAADKDRDLAKNEAAIVAVIGAEQAAFQRAELARLRPQAFSLTDSNPASRLQLRVTSKFAKSFSIPGLRDEPDYVGPKYGNGAESKVQQGYKAESKPLPSAFTLWLKTRPNNEFTEGANSENVINFYVLDKNPGGDSEKKTPEEKAKDMRMKARCRTAGERLFGIFLADYLRPFDQRRIETAWNNELNDYIPVNLDKIPVAFRFAKTLKGEALEVRSEKREAVAALAAEGSGICAYDVGVGKTYAAIFSIAHALDAGQCTRPVVVVPNQVYRQFVNEIKALLPHVPVNEFFNLGTDMEARFTVDGKGAVAAEVKPGSITVMTKEGLERIGFNQSTEGEMLQMFHDILNQGEQTNRQAGALMERLKTLIGRGLKDTVYNIEDFGFDFFCHDEAHAMKKVFATVQGEVKNGEREQHSYKIQSGEPSSYALRGFMLAQYIRNRTGGRNVLLLTATPFTNSPLEVYSMLALVAYDKLEAQGISNLKEFFDTYVKVSEELVITPSLKPAFKQVVMGFSNLASLQALIRRYINYKTADDVGAPRPDKIVLPLLNRREGDALVPLLPDERIETRLPLSDLQQRYMDQVEEYINGKSELRAPVANAVMGMGDADAERSEGAAVISESALTEKEKAGVRILRGINYARNIALSPYLYPLANLGMPTFEQYVGTSPKLSYVMECIAAVRESYAARQEAAPGQIIYMDRGVSFFPQLRDYLIYKLGYRPEEIGMIYSGLSAERKESIKNKFLGLRRNPQTGLEEPISHDDRIKVLIGSSTIKEGLNLQLWGGFLYNCFVDWNPTDVKQLEGRIWRYGNKYAACCIVTPLMENSVEPFIFQKLQEKTSRINEIWSRPGRINDLRLEEMNPEELKNALITDPEKVAENQLSDQKRTLEEKVQFFRGRLEETDLFIKSFAAYEAGLPKFRAYMASLSHEEVFGPPEELPVAPPDAALFGDDAPPPPPPVRERRMPNWETVSYNTLDKYYQEALYRKSLNTMFLGKEQLNRDAWNTAQGNYRVLKSNNLAMEGLPAFREQLAARVAELEIQAKDVASPERLVALTATITAERAQQAYSRRSVSERVQEFTRVIPRIRLKQQPAAAPVHVPVATVLQQAVAARNAAQDGGVQHAPTVVAPAPAAGHPYLGRKGSWYRKGDQVQLSATAQFPRRLDGNPWPAVEDAGRTGKVTSTSKMKRHVRGDGNAETDYEQAYSLNIRYDDGATNKYPVPQEAAYPIGGQQALAAENPGKKAHKQHFGPLSEKHLVLLRKVGNDLSDLPNKERQSIMSEVLGRKVKALESNSDALRHHLYKLAGINGKLYKAEKRQQYDAWLTGPAAAAPEPALSSNQVQTGFFKIGQQVRLHKPGGEIVEITDSRTGNDGRPEHMYKMASGREYGWTNEFAFYTLDHSPSSATEPQLARVASMPPTGAKGERLTDAASLDLLRMGLALLPQTKTLNVDENGFYTPERRALHRRIIDRFTHNRPCRQEQPIAVLTGGLPGSGKSHLVKSSPFSWINDERLVVHVDADAVRAELPEYQGWNAAQTHAETKDLVKEILDHIGEPCSHDVVYDGTMNKISSYLPLIEQLKGLGYRIYVLFVKVTLETSTQRVLERYRRTGRFVPLEVVEEAYHAGDSAFRQITQLVSGYMVYDGVTGQLLEQGGETIPATRDETAVGEIPQRLPEPPPAPAAAPNLDLAQAQALARARRVRVLKLRLKAPSHEPAYA